MDKLSYDVTISDLQGKPFDNVLRLFDAESLLKTHHSKPLISVTNLRGHIKSDIILMNKILRAEGYYNATVFEQVIRQDNHFKIDIRVTSGPLYRFGDIKINYGEHPPPEEINSQIHTVLNVNQGEPAKSESVVLADAHLMEILPKLGFPFSKNMERDVVVDHRNLTMNVTFVVETGVRRRMGKVHFKNSGSVEDNYITKLIQWQTGEYYKQDFIENLRERLIKSSLFSSVKIDLLATEDDYVDVVVTLAEAQHRTLGIAGGYSTAEGFGGEVSWEHNNLFHHGNRLMLMARTAEIEQSLTSRLEIPNFARLDQTLSFEGIYSQQNTDAFSSHTLEARGGIDRIITEKFALFAGVEFEYSDITEAQNDHNFYLVSLPVGMRWDSSDDLLDPHRGFRATITTAPSIGIDGSRFKFLKSELRSSAYYPVMAQEKIILALRIRLGSIIGIADQDVPATRRYYAGGGGSIRGFAFQRVGPLSLDNAPLGGRSVAEIAAEIRWKIMTDISLVPFVEGGNVYENQFPKFKNFLWGAGLGARYHTSFGPVRLDVAFPLNRRQSDSRVQFYISLGQAF
ncbi:MAG: autotransporter assembly complex protein TamA [Emcibacter sp.]|nr:autotransporter assembly complex protein TamA [Emcibacter sp.]